jgi:hypothetical protein
MPMDWCGLRLMLITRKLSKETRFIDEQDWNTKSIRFLNAICHSKELPENLSVEAIVAFLLKHKNEKLEEYVKNTEGFQMFLQNPQQYKSDSKHLHYYTVFNCLNAVVDDTRSQGLRIGCDEGFLDYEVIFVGDSSATLRFRVIEESELFCKLELFEIVNHITSVNYKFSIIIDNRDDFQNIVKQFREVKYHLSLDEYFRFMNKTHNGIIEAENKGKVSFFEKVKKVLTKQKN